MQQSADYKSFIVFYWEREEDGSYSKRFETFKTWQSASDFSFKLISNLDVFDPAGPSFRLEQIRAVY